MTGQEPPSVFGLIYAHVATSSFEAQLLLQLKFKGCLLGF